MSPQHGMEARLHLEGNYAILCRCRSLALAVDHNNGFLHRTCQKMLWRIMGCAKTDVLGVKEPRGGYTRIRQQLVKRVYRQCRATDLSSLVGGCVSPWMHVAWFYVLLRSSLLKIPPVASKACPRPVATSEAPRPAPKEEEESPSA